MATTWDLYDSFNALELSSLPVRQSIISSSSKANVPSKDRDQRRPGSTTDKSKISFISFFFLNEVFCILFCTLSHFGILTS